MWRVKDGGPVGEEPFESRLGVLPRHCLSVPVRAHVGRGMHNGAGIVIDTCPVVGL